MESESVTLPYVSPKFYKFQMKKNYFLAKIMLKISERGPRICTL